MELEKLINEEMNGEVKEEMKKTSWLECRETDRVV